jgi:hypothetical protein
MNTLLMSVPEMKAKIVAMQKLPAGQLRFEAKILADEIGRIKTDSGYSGYWTFGLVCILPEWKELVRLRYADIMAGPV